MFENIGKFITKSSNDRMRRVAGQSSTEQGVETGVALGLAGGFPPLGAAMLIGNGIQLLAADRQPNKGPLATLSESLFTFTEMRYPSNLAANEQNRYPYYIKFYINMADKSAYTGNITAVGGAGFASEEKHDALSEKLSTSWLQKGIRRKTKRTNQAILLYMPDTLTWGFGQKWSAESLTDALGSAGTLVGGVAGAGNMAAGAASMDQEEMIRGKEAALSASATEAAKAVNLLGTHISDSMAQAFVGKAVNPNEELLYKGVNFRDFQFDFTFAPRNSKDAKAALGIIQAFKFHAAPELPGGDGGRYMIPPSDFDIEFHNAHGEMFQLGSIGRCVLSNINVNFGAAGQFAAFADGYPSHITMQLQFKEIDIVTKRQIKESGF